MKQKQWKWLPDPHDCAVIFGIDAVDAYNAGETSLEALEGFGQVKFYEFNTLSELNAFLRGVDAAQGALDALPVDDLTQ
jgi:hypothetical protein